MKRLTGPQMAAAAATVAVLAALAIAGGSGGCRDGNATPLPDTITLATAPDTVIRETEAPVKSKTRIKSQKTEKPPRKPQSRPYLDQPVSCK